MKKSFLAVVILSIGMFIACKKVNETFATKKYSDKELSINSKSDFASEERKIKEGIMNFKDLSQEDRITLVKNLVMENKNPKAIINGMNILSKLTMKQKVEFHKILLPESNFKIYDNLKGNDIYSYTITPINEKPVSCWKVIENSYQYYGCPYSGVDICYRYNPNC